jgi:hypothetical protein
MIKNKHKDIQMKKILLTTATLVALASPALAVELGNGWAFDSTVTLDYYVESENTEAIYEGELNYQLNDEVKLYAFTEVDLKDVHFDGVDLGVNYSPAQVQYLNLNAEIQLDSDLDYSELVLTAEVSF